MVTGWLIALVLIVTSGCTGGKAQTQNTLPDRYVEKPAISQAAMVAFGEERATAAYYGMTNFVMSEGFKTELADPQAPPPTKEQLTTGITDKMVPATATAWNTLVDQAVAGDAEAKNGVRLLRFYDPEIPRAVMPADGDLHLRQTISNGTVDAPPVAAGATPVLRINFTLDTYYTLSQDRSPFYVHLNRALLLDVVDAATVTPSPAAPAATTPAGAAPAAPQPTPAPAAPATLKPQGGFLLAAFDGHIERGIGERARADAATPSPTPDPNAPAPDPNATAAPAGAPTNQPAAPAPAGTPS